MTQSGALTLADVMYLALDDEYRACATYQAVVDRFGPVTPFVNILQAEQQHIQALYGLFQRYGLPLPPDRWAGQVVAPSTLQQACQDGVAGEIGNYRMYDAFLQQIVEADARMVFTQLRDASALHHLPAFQNCAGSLASLPSALAGNNMYASASAMPATVNNRAGLAAGAALGIALYWWWRQRAA